MIGKCGGVKTSLLVTVLATSEAVTTCQSKSERQFSAA